MRHFAPEMKDSFFAAPHELARPSLQICAVRDVGGPAHEPPEKAIENIGASAQQMFLRQLLRPAGEGNAEVLRLSLN